MRGFLLVSFLSFSRKTLLWPSWLYYIGLGRGRLSARQWCNYIVNSHCVRHCELYTGRSLYLSHFLGWHYTCSTLLSRSLSQSRAVIQADTEGLRGWQWLCLCLKGIRLVTLSTVLSIRVSRCLADIKFAYTFCHWCQFVFHLCDTKLPYPVLVFFFCRVIIEVLPCQADTGPFSTTSNYLIILTKSNVFLTLACNSE